MVCSGHAHGSHKDSDGWTNFSACIQFLSLWGSKSYWLANFLDILAGLEPKVFNISITSMVSGLFIGIISAMGAAYCHRILNTEHQLPRTSESTRIMAETKAVKPLTWLQFFALLADGISHTLDIAMPITFTISLAHSEDFSWTNRVIIYSLTAVVGALASVSSVRTCKNVIKDRSKSSHQADASMSPYL